MKEEYDRISKEKCGELNGLKDELEEVSGQLSKERENFRKKLDAKDLELKSSQVKVDNLKSVLASSQKELKQLKVRFDNGRSKEKENLGNYEKTLNQLEKGRLKFFLN